MLNFRTNPNYSDKGISFSAGVSVGYLYSSRNKQISDERGKHKNRGDYDLEKWKFSYIAELGLGRRIYMDHIAPILSLKKDSILCLIILG